MPARKLSSVLVLAQLWGCYSTSVVGTSGEAPEQQEKQRLVEPAAPPVAASAPRMPSIIGGKPGERVAVDDPFLGDVDGDGFDDFLVSALVFGAEDRVYGDENTLAYLYYGRPDFPARLSTSDADAVFQTNEG